MRARPLVKIVVVSIALALGAMALPSWLARDRPWMSRDEALQAGLLGSLPFLGVAALAGFAAAQERRRGEGSSPRSPASLLGLLVVCGCWLLWVLLISSARTWF